MTRNFLSHRARHDALPGLVNRAEFELRLTRLLNRSRTDGSDNALLYIDLDQFKLVNDACGHAVGDQLLQQMARMLIDSVRTRDTVARLGGDEFAILMERCTVEQAQRVAQKLCDRMDDFRFVHEERRFRIGMSIGLVPVDRRWQTTAAIQQTLKLLGFWDGPVNGVWTDELTQAVKEFQTALGVEPTGEVDAATIAAFEAALEALKSLASPSPSSSPSSSPSVSVAPTT